jgi:hypothetical protein
MRIAVLPRQGGVHVNTDQPGDILRVSAHPEVGLVVISIWRDDHCVVTHEVPVADVPDLIAVLAQALVPSEAQAQATAS